MSMTEITVGDDGRIVDGHARVAALKSIEDRAIQADQYGVTLAPAAVEPRYASHSSLTKHRVCPQKWMYSSVRKLTKVEGDDAAVERDMGSWWHMLRAADAITRGRALGSLQWTPMELTSTDDGPVLTTGDISVVQVMDAARKWWDKQSTAVHDLWIERIGEVLPERLWTLYDRWAYQWRAEIASEQPLAVELRWERKLPALTQPGVLAAVDPNTTLVGYVDEVYYDAKRRVIIVRDHKLHKRLAAQTTVDDMMDSQLQLYAWGAALMVKAWDRGAIMATTYDRVRMVKPPTPAVTASGGLSKSVSDYDLHTYVDWCRDGVPWGEPGKFFSSGPRKGLPKFGRYLPEEREIERLSSPAATSSWFQRTGPTPLNANLIRAHLRAAVDSAIDMDHTYARAQATREAPRNLSKSNCQWCDFAGLCRAEMFGGTISSEYDLADFRLTTKSERRQ